MRNNDWLGPVLLTVAALFVINAASKAPWCGPTCQVILSDARGTLVKDLVTGLHFWV